MYRYTGPVSSVPGIEMKTLPVNGPSAKTLPMNSGDKLDRLPAPVQKHREPNRYSNYGKARRISIRGLTVEFSFQTFGVNVAKTSRREV